MKIETHNGAIFTDETFSPGYVWYKCDIYNLPDNTTGKVGYHVVYRPLCKASGYKGTEVVTEKMMEDTREHYEIEKKIEAEKEKKRLNEEIQQIMKNLYKRPGYCNHCHTYCDGDCGNYQP